MELQLKLAELLEKARAATPGPWFAKGEIICCAIYQGSPDNQRHLIDLDDLTWADAEFIAAARNSIVALIESHERLKAALLLSIKGGSAKVWQEGRDTAKKALAECPE